MVVEREDERGWTSGGNWETGQALWEDSVRVLRTYPKLIVLPLTSSIASLAFLLALYAPVLPFEVWNVLGLTGAGDVLLAVLAWYFGTAFVAAWFNAAIAHATRDVIEGTRPGVKRSLRATVRYFPALLSWAVVSALVGVFFRLLEASDSVLVFVVRLVVGAGWAITTYFVVPVIVFEDQSLRGAFRESRRLIADTWSEALGMEFAYWPPLLVPLVGIVASLGGVGYWLGRWRLAVLLTFAIAAVTYLVVTTIWMVAKTALYYYAREGNQPSSFSDVDFDGLGDSASGGRAQR